MKTPRDLLLAQHRAAEPKLDALRREVVDQCRAERQVNVHAVHGNHAETIARLFWRELILPSRRLWAGLAGAWVVILAVHFALRDPAGTGSPKVYVPAMMSFQEQQKLLNNLLTDRSAPVDVDRPKPFVPRPSGERTTFLTT